MSELANWRAQARSPRVRGGVSVAVLSLVTLGFYYAYWVYRLHAETPARQGVDPQKNFQWAAANVIRSVLFDKRLPHGDKGTKIRTKLSESLRIIHAHVPVLLRTGRVF